VPGLISVVFVYRSFKRLWHCFWSAVL